MSPLCLGGKIAAWCLPPGTCVLWQLTCPHAESSCPPQPLLFHDEAGADEKGGAYGQHKASSVLEKANVLFS